MHRFILQPDLSLLEKHGYIFVLPLEVDSVNIEKEKLHIEQGFKADTISSTVTMQAIS